MAFRALAQITKPRQRAGNQHIFPPVFSLRTQRDPRVKNLHADVAAHLPEELVEGLAWSPNLRIERIVSRGHSFPEGLWPEQAEHELVLLVSGSARLRFAGDYKDIILVLPGDHVTIAPHVRHRVESTAVDRDTLRLVVFYRQPGQGSALGHVPMVMPSGDGVEYAALHAIQETPDRCCR